MTRRAFGTSKRALALQEERIATWNKRHPVGTDVIVTEDDRTETKTSTVSVAWLLGGHTAVVALADRSGCFMLARVRPGAGPTLMDVLG